jgi:hypothetical protein
MVAKFTGKVKRMEEPLTKNYLEEGKSKKIRESILIFAVC